MKVLSLFDGMACGMIAFKHLGIPVEQYDAYEIDKYAMAVAKHNFPEIIERGDVFNEDFKRYEGNVDWLIGGSPCTYWSIAQSTDKRETTASGIGWELFSQYVRALREAKPKYFLYENNKSMSKQIRASITETFGFEPICINSSLVSAQNRQRLYWVGKRNEDGTYSKVDVEQPEDRGILLKDIMETGCAMHEKSYAYTTRCHAAIESDTFEKHRHEMAAEPVCVAEPINCTKDGKSYALTASYFKASENPFSEFGEEIRRPRVVEPVCMRYERTDEAKACRKAYEAHEIHHGYHELHELHPREDGKSNTLSTVLKDNPICEPVEYAITSSFRHMIGNCHSSVGINVNPSERGMNGDVIGVDWKSRSLTTNKGEGQKIIVPVCVAERGRYSDDGNIEQHYEVRGDKTNTLTTVAKDNQIAIPLFDTPLGKDCRPMRYPLESVNGKDAGIIGMLDMPKCHDILRRVYGDAGKSPTITTCGGGNIEPKVFQRINIYAIPSEFDSDGYPVKAISCAYGKEYPVYRVQDGQITIKGKTYPTKLIDGFYIIRKLTVTECKRLQTVPEWYNMSVISDSQAYKCLGNGWTVEVIMHLISSVMADQWG